MSDRSNETRIAILEESVRRLEARVDRIAWAIVSAMGLTLVALAARYFSEFVTKH